MAYQIYWEKSAAKELESVDRPTKQKIKKKIEALSLDPRPHGHEKLSGSDNYKIRQGDFRVVYSIEDKILRITILKIGNRKEVYR